MYTLCYPKGIESIKSEMEDVGEPLVDVNFGHGRYEDWCNPPVSQ